GEFAKDPAEVAATLLDLATDPTAPFPARVTAIRTLRLIELDTEALAYATSVTHDDFTIAPIDDDDESAHDLIAVW
ncbi:MAG: hypothetical protein VYA56_00785, partial [Actinomycetota bacterium]|nr:hypothetical protein [Actinomycetota bacterium]